MSEVATDRTSLLPDLPDPFTEWYRERPFQVAFAISVLIHALLILVVPELRSVQIDPPQVLNVELATQTAPAQKPIVQPRAEPLPQPEAPPPMERQAVPPEPVIEPPPVQQAQPEAPPPARAQLAPPPPAPRDVQPEPLTRTRPEPQPEHRVEIPQQKVLPQAPPDVLPPPPQVRAEPKPIPQEPPRIEPEIQRVPPPAAEAPPPPVSIKEPVPPVARVEPLPAPDVSPRVEPRPQIAPPPTPERPVVQSPAPPVTTQPVTPPPASAAPRQAEVARELTMAYSQQLSSQIKRHQKYPLIAQRRKWEGTAEVLLKVSPDGRVTNIELARSTGREVLDREALEMVKRATPLPQAPQALRGQELSVTVPIVFRLQDS